MSNAARRAALGGRVERLRLAQNLSQNELARRAGLNPSQVTRIESGANAAPQLGTLEKLASGLGISVAELLNGRSADVRASHDGLGAGAPAEGDGAHTGPADRANVRVESNVVGRVDELRASWVRPLPVYAWGTAGDPLSEHDAPAPLRLEYPPLDQALTIGPKGFGVVVRGNSMTNRGIVDGSIVWVNPQEPVREKRPVLAEVESTDGDRGMVIKLYDTMDGGTPVLRSDGESGNGVVLASAFRIIGPVVYVQPPGFVVR